MTAPLLGYQYVVLRCVPRVDRDELMNVGVVLHSLSVAFLDRAFAVDPQRLRSFSPDLARPTQVSPANPWPSSSGS